MKQTKITQFFLSTTIATQVNGDEDLGKEHIGEYCIYSPKSPYYCLGQKSNEKATLIYEHMLDEDYQTYEPNSPSIKTWPSDLELDDIDSDGDQKMDDDGANNGGINCEDEMEQQFEDEYEPSNGPIIFNSPPSSPDPSPSPSPFVFSDGPEETTKHYPSEESMDEVPDESMDEVRRLYPSPPLSDRFYYFSS